MQSLSTHPHADRKLGEVSLSTQWTVFAVVPKLKPQVRVLDVRAYWCLVALGWLCSWSTACVESIIMTKMLILFVDLCL